MPNGAQEKFITSVGNGDYFIGIFSAGNGVGKTALAVNIIGACIFDHQNPYFHYPLFDNFSFPRRIRIVSSSKNLEEIGAIQTELKRWFPIGKYESKKMGKPCDAQYIVEDWVIDVMSYGQDVSQFESATLGLVVFDEPPPTPILYATMARMRAGGMILIFMTPLDTGGEIIEDLTSRETVICDGKELGRVYIQYADISENCQEHGIRGQLKHSDITNMLNFYDTEERAAREKGKPIHMLGRIYADYEDTDPYVVEDFGLPQEWTRVQIIDPHDAIPYAISWAAIDPTGQIWIYDEFPTEYIEKMRMTSLTIPDYARIIREKEGRQGVYVRIIDPFFGNKRYSNTGKSVKEELLDLGFEFIDGDTSGLDLGHQKVREYLKYQKQFPASANNHPKLHILSHCINHRRALSRYKRKFQKSGEVKDKIVIDETYKHFCDNLRHLVMYPDLYALRRPPRVVIQNQEPVYVSNI